MMARCPYCSAGILAAQAFCSSCGRQLPGAAPAFPNQAGMYAPPQAMPATLAPASPATPGGALFPQSAQAGKEKRHHWIWLGSLITIGVGGWILYAHWQGTVGLGVALGLFALAVLSLGLSRFGARWQRALDNLLDSDEHAEPGRRENRLAFQTCPRCGQIVPPGLRICPRCGQPLR